MLAAGMAAQASISALQLGLPAVAPEIRRELDLSLAGTGALLAASTIGIIATLLGWGALADRVGERAVIAIGLTGCAGALVLASRMDGAVAMGAWLLLAGALGSSANAASGRAEARALQEQALEGLRRVLGDEHPDTLTSMSNLAKMLEVGPAGALLTGSSRPPRPPSHRDYVVPYSREAAA